MADGGNTIGRANVEIGADTTKLDAGLAAAKEKTVAAVQQTEQAAAKVQPPKPAVDINAEVRAEAEARYAASERQNESLNRQETIQKTISQRIKENTKAAREFLEAVRGAFGIITGIVGVVGLVAGAVRGVMAIVENANQKLVNLANTIVAVAKSYDELGRKTFSDRKYADDFAKRRALLFDFNNEQKKAIEEARDAEIAAAIEAGNALDSEAVKRAEARAQEARDTAERKYQEEYRIIQRQEREADERARVRAQEDESNFKRTQERIRNAAIETERQIRMERHAEMLDDIRKLMADYDAIEREFAARQRDRLRQQAEQFAQLRGEINGLFNTSSLEVGINRVGQLIETLIQKTGDNR